MSLKPKSPLQSSRPVEAFVLGLMEAVFALFVVCHNNGSCPSAPNASRPASRDPSPSEPAAAVTGRGQTAPHIIH